jgi:hypothetical protein
MRGMSPSSRRSRPGRPTAGAQTRAIGNGVGGVIELYPYLFTQPFAEIVHTLAHELGHIEQRFQGIVSNELREFLSEGIELESKNMPVEALETEADIDLMLRTGVPTTPGFINDAMMMLRWWNLLTPAEKAAHHQRYKDLRLIIVTRIANQGTAGQKQKLAPFLQQLQTADAGVP